MSEMIDPFRQKIEEKYQGKRVISSMEEEIIVETIADLNFYNLDPEDRYEAIQNQWAWGINHIEGEDAVFHGILYRPVAREFLLAEEPYLALFGGYGSAKTTFGALLCTQAMWEFPGIEIGAYRTTLGLVRETVISTTMKLWTNFLGLKEGQHFYHKKTDQKLVLNVKGGPSIINYGPFKDEMVSLDKTIDDFKGKNYSMMWIDESPRLQYELFKAIQARGGRQEGLIVPDEWCKTILTGNPPDETHYQYIMFEEKEDIKDRGVKMKDAELYRIFRMGSYHNRDGIKQSVLRRYENLPPAQRRIFLDGKSGYIAYGGIGVYEKAFDDSVHIHEDYLPYDPDKSLVLGWDMNVNGKHKACVIGQWNQWGQLDILLEHCVLAPSIPVFIDQVIRLCSEMYPCRRKAIDYVDPAAKELEQLTLKSPMSVMRARGRNPLYFEGYRPLSVRTDAVTTLMMSSPGGTRRCIRISEKGCPTLVKGLRGAYRYPVRDETEGIVGEKPIKNEWSHPNDALQYLVAGCELNLSPEEQAVQDMQVRERNFKQMQPRGLVPPGALTPKSLFKDRFSRGVGPKPTGL